MNILIGLHRGKAGQGFTLLELLLATVLLLLLLGAMVFSYSTLQRGAALEEGVTQFEGLLRYAQAQAASTGRKVQLVVEQETMEDLPIVFSTMRVMWEPEPLTQPGEWVELSTAADLVQRIEELVQIETVQCYENGELPPPPSPSVSTNQLKAETADQDEIDEEPPTIVFYPDGSSDSADFTLAALDPEDTRRITVRLLGITGMVQRRLPVEETETATTETEKREPEKKTTLNVEPPARTEPPVRTESVAPSTTPAPKEEK